MGQDLDSAFERARLAAADLAFAAQHVIELHMVGPEDALDDVTAAVLSRRFTSYAESRRLDDARDDLAFASQARTELEDMSATLAAPAAGDGSGGPGPEATLVDRLLVIAAECERRAVALRS